MLPVDLPKCRPTQNPGAHRLFEEALEEFAFLRGLFYIIDSTDS